MLRPLTLLLALLAAPAARACAVAEGCPMGETFDPCATVRVADGFLCLPDPADPSGFVVVPDGGPVLPEVPDCGLRGEDGCAMPLPGGPGPGAAGQVLGAGLAAPLAGLMVLLGVAAGR